MRPSRLRLVITRLAADPPATDRQQLRLAATFAGGRFFSGNPLSLGIDGGQRVAHARLRSVLEKHDGGGFQDSIQAGRSAAGIGRAMP